jgi:hypothetical protein
MGEYVRRVQAEIEALLSLTHLPEAGPLEDPEPDA